MTRTAAAAAPRLQRTAGSRADAPISSTVAGRSNSITAPRLRLVWRCSLVGDQANVTCVDRRRFTFKIHQPRHGRVTRVTVFVNGKRRLSLRGKDIQRVSIARLPRKRFVVRIETTSSTGARLISTRVYHGCKKTRPRTHR